MAQSLVAFYAEIWNFSSLDRHPGVSGAQVMARRPQFIGEYAE